MPILPRAAREPPSSAGAAERSALPPVGGARAAGRARGVAAEGRGARPMAELVAGANGGGRDMAGAVGGERAFFKALAAPLAVWWLWLRVPRAWSPRVWRSSAGEGCPPVRGGALRAEGPGPGAPGLGVRGGRRAAVRSSEG